MHKQHHQWSTQEKRLKSGPALDDTHVYVVWQTFKWILIESCFHASGNHFSHWLSPSALLQKIWGITKNCWAICLFHYMLLPIQWVVWTLTTSIYSKLKHPTLLLFSLKRPCFLQYFTLRQSKHSTEQNLPLFSIVPISSWENWNITLLPLESKTVKILSI